MRVLHVISDENIGGAGVLLSTLLGNFDIARVQSAVALPRGSKLCERIAGKGVEIYELHHSCDRITLTSVKEIARLIRQTQSDLVHTNAALSARVAGRLCRIPVVHTRHCCYPPSGIWKRDWIRRAGGVCNRLLSDRVIATADAAAENLRMFGVPNYKIEVIVNGSEHVREVSEDELMLYRERWGLDQEDFTVGICARLEFCKGHDTFLKMAQILLQCNAHSFKFLIVGEGTRRRELEKTAEHLGIANRVIFTGFVRDMAVVYRLLRVNVNCSEGTETSCLVLSEGMSAGLPSVVSDYGGNAAMIGNSAAGFVVPMGDASAFADAVQRIAEDQGLEAAMKDAAHQRYLGCYTAREMSERVTRLYESLL